MLADRIQVQQVLLNLIRNGAEAKEDGFSDGYCPRSLRFRSRACFHSLSLHVVSLTAALGVRARTACDQRTVVRGSEGGGGVLAAGRRDGLRQRTEARGEGAQPLKASWTFPDPSAGSALHACLGRRVVDRGLHHVEDVLPAHDLDRARRAFDSRLARAKWVSSIGYRKCFGEGGRRGLSDLPQARSRRNPQASAALIEGRLSVNVADDLARHARRTILRQRGMAGHGSG